MCTSNPIIHKPKKPFNLKHELFLFFGEKKAKQILLRIEQRYMKHYPLQAISIAFSGNGRFNDKGDIITSFNHKEDLYNYLITFRKKVIDEGIEVEETFYFTFN